VKQRDILNKKSVNPHILVMSATPIPRTLALIIYSDLDISILNEMPSGRIPISTHLRGEDDRDNVYKFFRSCIEKGQQGYIICPLVEENDATELKSVTAFLSELQKNHFAGISIEKIYGKLKASEKNRVMKEFSNGDIKVLVSTTVIEVGIDVPNATVMVIENAERFGLSQLHQLRGRIGRGSEKSHCIMMSGSKNYLTLERLKTMVLTNDGFKISEKDLELRGPGDFFGKRQHGLPEFKIADISTDIQILDKVKKSVGL